MFLKEDNFLMNSAFYGGETMCKIWLLLLCNCTSQIEEEIKHKISWRSCIVWYWVKLSQFSWNGPRQLISWSRNFLRQNKTCRFLTVSWILKSINFNVWDYESNPSVLTYTESAVNIVKFMVTIFEDNSLSLWGFIFYLFIF